MNKLFNLFISIFLTYSVFAIYSCGSLNTTDVTNDCFVYTINSIEINAGDSFVAYEIGTFAFIANGNYLISIDRSGDFQAKNLTIIHEGTEFVPQIPKYVKPLDKLAISGWTTPDMSGQELIKISIFNQMGSLVCQIEFTIKIKPKNTSNWNLSLGGNSDWEQLPINGFYLEELGFGDFDGDERTDIIVPTGTEWLISYQGNSPWTTLASSGYKLNELGFGDFDGDKKTDILRTSGTKWIYASSMDNYNWKTLATSGYKLNELGFGDFDGDGKTDVLRTSGTKWIYASSMDNYNWKTLATSEYTLNELSIGVKRMNVHPWIYYSTGKNVMSQIDFNGDSITDILRTN